MKFQKRIVCLGMSGENAQYIILFVRMRPVRANIEHDCVNTLKALRWYISECLRYRMEGLTA